MPSLEKRPCDPQVENLSSRMIRLGEGHPELRGKVLALLCQEQLVHPTCREQSGGSESNPVREARTETLTGFQTLSGCQALKTWHSQLLEDSGDIVFCLIKGWYSLYVMSKGSTRDGCRKKKNYILTLSGVSRWGIIKLKTWDQKRKNFHHCPTSF